MLKPYPGDGKSIASAIVRSLRLHANDLHPTAGGWRAYHLWIANAVECGDLIVAVEDKAQEQG